MPPLAAAGQVGRRRLGGSPGSRRLGCALWATEHSPACQLRRLTRTFRAPNSGADAARQQRRGDELPGHGGRGGRRLCPPLCRRPGRLDRGARRRDAGPCGLHRQLRRRGVAAGGGAAGRAARRRRRAAPRRRLRRRLRAPLCRGAGCAGGSLRQVAAARGGPRAGGRLAPRGRGAGLGGDRWLHPPLGAGRQPRATAHHSWCARRCRGPAAGALGPARGAGEGRAQHWVQSRRFCCGSWLPQRAGGLCSARPAPARRRL